MSNRGALALVGGGEFEAQCEFDLELLEQGASKKRIQKKEVLIIPSASAYENPSKKIQLGTGYFENLGATVNVLDAYTRSEALEANLEALKTATIIYLTDGSAMHLRSILKNTDLFEEIKSAWQDGAALVGAGAGGDVLCDYMVDARGGAFTVGLRVLTEISMIPRYDLWSEEKVSRTVNLAPKDLFVAGVPHQTALISEAGKPWKKSGKGDVDVFRGGEENQISDLPLL